MVMKRTCSAASFLNVPVKLVVSVVDPCLLTPRMDTARKMGLLWGVHAVRTKDIGSFEEMIAKGRRMALRHGIARAGDKVIMVAGVPFGTPGSTNVLHVATITGDELKGREEGD